MESGRLARRGQHRGRHHRPRRGDQRGQRRARHRRHHRQRKKISWSERRQWSARSNGNWTYLSPSAGRIEPGERTGRFRIGGDQLLAPADGAGDISAEDVAVALVDEAEQPRHIQRRFTVGY
ncbi:NAD(P)-dependent oxidoreductase [Nocardia brasiliensis]|uniref:NAD(P)-dependent oxidoreductase n=1 Tax=Nocardia brasiliensis TaxID=37326 RepID=UPI00366D3CAC